MIDQQYLRIYHFCLSREASVNIEGLDLAWWTLFLLHYGHKSHPKYIWHPCTACSNSLNTSLPCCLIREVHPFISPETLTSSCSFNLTATLPSIWQYTLLLIFQLQHYLSVLFTAKSLQSVSHRKLVTTTSFLSSSLASILHIEPAVYVVTYLIGIMHGPDKSGSSEYVFPPSI